MTTVTDLRDWRERQIREWLLLLLRYAISHDAADQNAAFSFADELDSAGVWWRPRSPSFFRRTSQEVCAAIRSGATPTNAILRKHIARIDNPRLKQAFAAAVGFQMASNLQQQSTQHRTRKRAALWRGLTYQGSRVTQL